MPTANAVDYFLTWPSDPAGEAWSNFVSDWTQNTPSRPLWWSGAALNEIIYHNPKRSGLDGPNVTLVLKSGPGCSTYRIAPYSTPSSATEDMEDLVLVLRSSDPSHPATLQYVPQTSPNLNREQWPLFKGAYTQTAILRFFEGQDSIAGFECHDLILDANWPEWAHPLGGGGNAPIATPASPAWVDGFKLSALYVQAASGWLSNVKIINCGANGPTPQSYWQDGFEAFPLTVKGTTFSPTRLYGSGMNEPFYAWIIEDCEVSRFHGVHGGYCTAIMIQTPTPDPPPTNPSTRFGVVRRCQVYGTGCEIAFGSARSAGITYCDNVAVGVKVGLNHDTPGPGMMNFDITNNVFLDVALMANVGSSAQASSAWHNYEVSGNAARLLGVPLEQYYNDFEWKLNTIGTQTRWQPVTDTTLAVGRYATGYCAGLRLGGTSDIRYTNNWFTTRPRLGFFGPDPATTDPNLAKWTPLYTPTTDPLIPGWSVTHDWNTYRTNGNTLSPVAFDFGGNPTTLAAPADSRPAVATNPTDFVPGGWTGRVQPEYDDSNNDGRLELATVLEVGVTAPALNGQQVQIKARLLNHMLPPTLGISVPQTAPIPPQSILHCAVVEGGNQGASVTAAYNGTIATYTYSPASSVGRDLLVVWYDQPGGTDGQWDRDIDVWSAAEMLLGETVRFERMPDVANDLRIASGMLRIARPNALPTPLQVTLRPAASSLVARSATPAVDYQLVVYQNVVPFNNNQWTVTIPGGQRCLEVAMRALSDTTPVREYEAAYFELVGNLPTYNVAPPGPWVTAYANSAVQAAAVTIWDGPLYRAKALYDHYYYNCGSALMVGTGSTGIDAAAEADDTGAVDPNAEILPASPDVDGSDVLSRVEATMLEWQPSVSGTSGEPMASEASDGDAALLVEAEIQEPASQVFEPQDSQCYQSPETTHAYALNQVALPTIAGDAHYKGTYEFDWGGKWLSDYSGDLVAVGTPWSSYFMVGVDDAGGLVGNAGTSAYYINSGGTPELLPPYNVGYPATVTWVPPNGSKPVGYARNGSVIIRPVQWYKYDSYWQTPVNLGSFYKSMMPLPEDEPTKPGYAYGVNNSDVKVGKSRYQVNGTSVFLAFRTDGLLSNTNDHQLVFPQTNPPRPGLLNSSANAINSAGAAVGAADTWVYRGSYVAETHGVYWAQGYNGRTNAYDLGTIAPGDLDPAYIPGRSEALGVNTTAYGHVIVGKGYTTRTGYTRAFVMYGYAPGVPMINLNDPHITYNQSGQVLISAEDINNQGWIVGNGDTRGFVLIRQPLATE